MSSEIDTETDAHYQVDHGDAVQTDVPEGHVPSHSTLDGDDAKSDPQTAQNIGYEDERDEHHHQGTEDHALDTSRSN